MEYPIVYDKFETDFTHYGLAVLENVINPRIFERLNGEYVLDFSIPRTDEKFDAIKEENIVKVNGQYFVIRTLTEQRTNNNELIANVFCEHISSELITEYKQSVSLTASTPQVIVNALLSGTRFTGTAVNLLGTHNFNVERKNVISGINHFIAITDSEMKRDNFNIEFKPQIGADNGVAFRYRKNLKGIKRTIDSKNIVTRLYVYGKDGLSISPIDSQYIGNYPRPKIEEITFSDIDDTVKLQQLGQEQFTVKKIDIPYVTYEVDVVELKKAKGYDETEGFAIGDTVGVFDEELNLTLTARIFEYEEFPLQPENSRAVLANFVPSIEDALAQLQDTRSIVEQVTRNGKVNTYWLDGVINALTNQIKASGSYANATALANKGFLLENNNINSSDYGAMYLGPGWLMIANTKLGDGSWNWRTFGTGKGFTADHINAGKILTSVVQIVGEENHFYWDAGALYCKDAVDENKQIKLSKAGLQFTTNGGVSWSIGLGFNGLVIGSNASYDAGYDPSTKETPTGAQTKADAAQTAAAADATTKMNEAKADAAAAQTSANAAQTTANGAQTSANSANTLLTDIASDSKLTPGEKQAIKKEWDIIVAEKPTIDTQATTYVITTEKTNYGTSYDTLNTYITPLLADLTVTSDIVGATFRTNFKDYYDKKTILLKVIVEKAKTLADTAQQRAVDAETTAINTAATDATTKAAAAEQAAKDASVLKDISYSDVIINSTVGVKATHPSGDYTQLSGTGLKRYVASSGQLQEFNYLTAVGSGETGGVGTKFDSGGARDAHGSSANIGTVWVQLPDDFKGKTFDVALASKGGDPVGYAGQDGESFWVPTVSAAKTYLAVKTWDYPNGKFEIEGWGFYYHQGSDLGLYKKYYALEYSYMVVV